jgi:glyoxylase-like metal-dependent hydrolase (beta-lactamase superfamily II)
MVTLVETFAVGTFQCNCTIIADEASREAIVVDPGDEAPRIIERLRAHDLHVTYLIHTHAHIDHVMATTDVKRECGGKALLHPGDNVLYDNLAMQGTFLGIQDVGEHDPMDGELVDGQSIALGDSIQLQVLHTPGHTQGSCCFHAELDGKGLVFSGDTLFMRGIGRTDLWGGSHPQLMESINQRLLPMDGDTLVVPGHGGNTTIGDEKLKNPFLR